MSDISNVTERTQVLVDSITGAILSTVEVASERIALASEVAKVQQRMDAFSTILETIGTQKEVLEEKVANTKGPLRKLYQSQLEALTKQELVLLKKAGVVTEEPEEPAVPEGPPVDGQLYKRVGKKFVKVESQSLPALPEKSAG
jgi:chaperonin cofactor prefoldin